MLTIASSGTPRESSHTSALAVVKRAVTVEGIDTYGLVTPSMRTVYSVE